MTGFSLPGLLGVVALKGDLQLAHHVVVGSIVGELVDQVDGYLLAVDVGHGLATALIDGAGLDERSATGGVFCTQWLNERTVEMEQQLKDIVSRAYASTTVAGS